ncbi:MAG: diaminopimelate epimerase [Phycisphaerales bacterium]|nr:diaminopimelate epimerase [Phycisphaerales bacterium]
MMEDVIMHGTGNRFLLHCGDKDPATLLKNLRSVDGLLILSCDDKSDLRMQIFNADGSEAQQCGNGLRCAALHAFRSQLAQNTTMTIRTISGTNKCLVHPQRNEVEVTMGFADIGAMSCGVCVEGITDLPELQFVNMGNPNAVLWTDINPIDICKKYGPMVSQHPSFSQGINLHVAKLDATNHATVASWERGVGPTLASGTGGASVFVTSKQESPFVVTSLGGSLTYSYSDDGQIVMSGPAAYD